jgi:hypothetical protein
MKRVKIFSNAFAINKLFLKKTDHNFMISCQPVNYPKAVFIIYPKSHILRRMAQSEDRFHTAKELTAGSVGGICQVLVGQPFDTVKVRLQTSNLYSGVIDCASKTLKSDGLMGFYKGTLTPLLGV